jgi:hypothetical protein
MGENGRPPLSRRVPGATNMPKAQVRASPPKLPDHVLERLRAEVSAIREKTAEQPNAKLAEQPNAKLAEQADVAPQRPANVIRLQRPKNMDGPRRPTSVAEPQPPKNVDAPQRPKNVDGPQAPKRAAWHVVPDSSYSPVADSDDTTEPIPVVQLAKPSTAITPDRNELTGPAGGVDHEPDRAARQEKVDRPRRRRRRDNAKQRVSAVAAASAVPPANAVPPVSAEQPASASRLDKPSANGRTSSAGVARSRTGRELSVVPPRARARARTLRRGRRPNSLAAASQPTSDRQATMLQGLFAETDAFEEIVASARAQAGGRRADLEWRYRMVALIVTALVILGVLVFLASR